MADLYRIFSEEGLAGLLPYALKDTSHGYRILVDKIKAGYPLTFIRTQMEVPYLVVKNETYQALFYTTEDKARAQASELKAQGFNPVVEDLPDGKAREEALLWLFDHGPTHILLDDSLSVPISDLVDEELPDYDGRPTTEHKLRNRMLNGATFYFLQQAAAGYGNMEAEYTWTRSMVNGEFLAACINDPANNYPALALTMENGLGLLVYTDWRQVQLDNPEGEPACFVLDFEGLKRLLALDTKNVILLNHATCNLSMNLEYMSMIEESSRNARSSPPTGRSQFSQQVGGYALGQVNEDDWDTTDPTPDFLK